MTGLEITLIILGIVFIFISFLLTDKPNNGKDAGKPDESVTELWNEKDEKLIQQRVETLLRETADSLVLDVRDQLNHLSNEKIMSLSEYSEQVMEKINENHKEVVFLYNMLNEKQNEIKKLIHFFDKKKTVWEEAITNHGESKVDGNQDAKQLESGVAVAKKKTNATSHKVEAKVVNTGKKSNRDLDDKMDENDKKDRILQLRKEGKSIIEISKSLNMGQGEVKLIIDLYKG